MQKFMNFLKAHSSLIALIALGIAGGCSFLSYVGSFPEGFLPVVAHLLEMIFIQGILAGIFVCILLKKENILKVSLPLVFAAWLFHYMLVYFDYATMAQGDYPPIAIAVGVFAFFVAIIMLGIAVLKILSKILKPIFGTIADLALLGSIPFFFVLMILLIAEYATYEANWSSYFYAFFTMAAPVGIIFAYLPFSGSDMDDFFVKETASKGEKAEEPAKEEEPAAEEPAKEEPAEETKEETADENIDPAIFDENDENK